MGVTFHVQSPQRPTMHGRGLWQTPTTICWLCYVPSWPHVNVNATRNYMHLQFCNPLTVQLSMMMWRRRSRANDLRWQVEETVKSKSRDYPPCTDISSAFFYEPFPPPLLNHDRIKWTLLNGVAAHRHNSQSIKRCPLRFINRLLMAKCSGESHPEHKHSVLPSSWYISGSIPWMVNLSSPPNAREI